MLDRRMFECLCAHIIIRFILSYMNGVQSVYNKFLDHTRKKAGSSTKTLLALPK